MDFTQQLKVPTNQGFNSRQGMLMKIAIGGAILAVILFLATALTSGKSSQPQMEAALNSHAQLKEVAEAVQEYELTPTTNNTAISTQSVASSSFSRLSTIAAETYPKFKFVATYDNTEVLESLKTANQQGTTDEQARRILSNLISITLNDLTLLSSATSNEQIKTAVVDQQAYFTALQTQLSGN